MTLRLLRDHPDDRTAYDMWVKTHADGTLWQSLEYKDYQDACGRETHVYLVCDEQGAIRASALVIIHRTVLRFSTWSLPRGPVWNDVHALMLLLQRIHADARADHCFSLYVSPVRHLPAQCASLFTDLRTPLQPSARHEQPDASLLIDLRPSQEEILAQMHQKARYNIRVATRHGVTVARSEDIDTYVVLAIQTSLRDSFVAPSASHLRTFLSGLPHAFLLMAHASSGKPICGLLGVLWNDRGIYYYGASDHSARALMAPYLVQWEAMQLSKSAGCKQYDLLGISSPDGSTPAWDGITVFKRKFGGSLVSYPHEQEVCLRPLVRKALKMKRLMIGSS